MSLVVAILGAESTGKTSLARALQDRLRAEGVNATAVPELLRGWCEREGRTPYPDEQAAIADAQTAAIDAAAREFDLVLCDTTALMTAVYSDYIFNDRSLIEQGLAFHRRCDLTLLTALDIDWVADPGIREGAHVRQPVDTLIRAALTEGGIPWTLVSGQGEARVEAALNAIRPLLIDR